MGGEDLKRWARELRLCPASPFTRPDLLQLKREIALRIQQLSLDQVISLLSEYPQIEKEWIPFVLSPIKDCFEAQLKGRLELEPNCLNGTPLLHLIDPRWLRPSQDDFARLILEQPGELKGQSLSELKDKLHGSLNRWLTVRLRTNAVIDSMPAIVRGLWSVDGTGLLVECLMRAAKERLQ